MKEKGVLADWTLAHEATRRGDARTLRKLVEAGASPIVRSKGGSVMELAWFVGAKGCVDLLAALGAGLDAKKKKGAEED